MLYLRPFFSYFGSKWRLAPTYPRPEHRDLIEAFAGGAGYACRHYKRRVLLIEKDPRIAALWAWLIKVSPAEVLKIPLFGNGIESVDDMKGIAEEARTLVGKWLFTSNGIERKPSRTMQNQLNNGSAAYWGWEARHRIAHQVQRIRHWRVIHGSYEDAPDVEATWFLDPPYQRLGVHYRQGSTGIDYASLASWVRARRGLTIACEAEPADWLPFEHHAYAVGAKNRPNDPGAVSRELIYVQRA